MNNKIKTLTHTLTKDKEAKLLLYTGNNFIHLIVFKKTIGHYQVINKIKKHFQINDTNTKAGWIIDGRQEFFSNAMVNERITIANQKEGLK